MCRITGYSREIPLAPSIARAVRATSSADRTFASLPKLTWLWCSRPASLSAPIRVATSPARLTSTTRSASLRWVSWNPASGLPNCSRLSV